jgi:hypothetical protein
MDPKPSISLLNQTDTLNEYYFTIKIFEDEVNALQKESWCCRGVIASLVTGNSTKISFVF